MSLDFQERGDGYRVCRVVNGVEHMVASVETRTLEEGSPRGRWVPLPRENCTVRAASGPLRVADLEEILERLRQDEQAWAASRRAELERELASLPGA